jgi:hypothetical protein
MPISNKVSFTLGNLFGACVVGLTVVACSGGSGPSALLSDAGTISASNIILNQGINDARAGNGIIRVQANQLPSNVQVLASNVSLTTANNSLISTDLQTALDKELATNLASSLVGTWTISNVTSDSIYSGSLATGRVTFNADGSYAIASGGFAAAGKVASGTGSFCAIPTSQTYQVIDGAIYFAANAGGDSVAVVAKNTADAITLIGDGGCGAQGVARISKLTRVTTTPVAASRKINKSGYLTVSF